MKILIIHAGGTISMARTPDGFAPRKGVLEAELERLRSSGQIQSEVDIFALDPLIDSAYCSPVDWNRMTGVILDHHADYDAFIVTHGTDTLAYSAAALCFALEGLAKPIILTGSMLPLTEAGSDGGRNLKDSLSMVGSLPHGVWVQFAGRLLSGTRVWKTHSSSMEAFSANPSGMPPHRRGPQLVRHVYKTPALAILPFAPGVSMDLFAYAMGMCDGLVLRCYGSGTAPDTPSLRAALAKAQERGMPVVAVSQCAEGGIALGRYASDQLLLEHGVIDGRDMTVEAAYAKLALALSMESSDDRDALLKQCICGEFT
ncbi:asparaginase [uncultured Cohaesibacter sp.]|uniref:asparaginase n=1 Tax=uncultured Cohaesibacter sp. TaxID=1002546 RepID=UPI0029C97BC4|nr:asparaginase [uncultured Cohaesibacter sp.]